MAVVTKIERAEKAFEFLTGVLNREGKLLVTGSDLGTLSAFVKKVVKQPSAWLDLRTVTAKDGNKFLLTGELSMKFPLAAWGKADNLAASIVDLRAQGIKVSVIWVVDGDDLARRDVKSRANFERLITQEVRRLATAELTPGELTPPFHVLALIGELGEEIGKIAKVTDKDSSVDNPKI